MTTDPYHARGLRDTGAAGILEALADGPDRNHAEPV
jgi:hypothetical protein